MKAKLKRYSDRKRGGDINIPVLHLQSENKEEKEILNQIFESEKLVPVAQGDYPDFQFEDVVENRKVSFILLF